MCAAFHPHVSSCISSNADGDKARFVLIYPEIYRPIQQSCHLIYMPTTWHLEMAIEKWPPGSLETYITIYILKAMSLNVRYLQVH